MKEVLHQKIFRIDGTRISEKFISQFKTECGSEWYASSLLDQAKKEAGIFEKTVKAFNALFNLKNDAERRYLQALIAIGEKIKENWTTEQIEAAEKQLLALEEANDWPAGRHDSPFDTHVSVDRTNLE